MATQTKSGAADESQHEQAVSASDAIVEPILEVTQDGYEIEARCLWVELDELVDRRWLTAYHEYSVDKVSQRDPDAGVIAHISWHPE